MAHCPHCGLPVTLNKATRPPGWFRPDTFHTLQAFENAVNSPLPVSAADNLPLEFAAATRETPVRPPTLESDFLVPVAKSLVTGLIALPLAFWVNAFLRWPWWSPLLLSTIIAALMWFYLLDIHHRMLWSIETITNRDLDRDGHPGSPPPKPVTLEVHHQVNGRVNRTQYLDLPTGVTQAMLIDFAQRYAVIGLTTDAWVGRGNPFSRKQFDQFTAALTEAGILAWVDPGNRRAGRRVTRGGQAALAHLANSDHL